LHSLLSAICGKAGLGSERGAYQEICKKGDVMEQSILEIYLISFWAVILVAGGMFKIGEWILKLTIRTVQHKGEER
jgi:hypothetical protein